MQTRARGLQRRYMYLKLLRCLSLSLDAGASEEAELFVEFMKRTQNVKDPQFTMPRMCHTTYKSLWGVLAFTSVRIRTQDWVLYIQLAACVPVLFDVPLWFLTHSCTSRCTL
eukprot:3473666-Amphidinium_carterae.2